MTPIFNATTFSIVAPSATVPVDNEALKQAAQEFEAAFIGQMLTFSGLGDALVSGEGKMASAFTGFFIEALAADLAETGAFGLAEQFYDKLKAQEPTT